MQAACTILPETLHRLRTQGLGQPSHRLIDGQKNLGKNMLQLVSHKEQALGWLLSRHGYSLLAEVSSIDENRGVECPLVLDIPWLEYRDRVMLGHYGTILLFRVEDKR